MVRRSSFARSRTDIQSFKLGAFASTLAFDVAIVYLALSMGVTHGEIQSILFIF